jgi:hypothetical protein
MIDLHQLECDWVYTTCLIIAAIRLHYLHFIVLTQITDFMEGIWPCLQ